MGDRVRVLFAVYDMYLSM